MPFVSSNHSSLLLLFAFFFLAAGTAAAAPFPDQLKNKSIVVSFSVAGSGKRTNGAVSPISGSAGQQVYISSAGRAFVREQQSSILGNASKDVPVRPAAGNNFNGRLKLPMKLDQGTLTATVTFDANFTSCSVIPSISPGKVVFRAPSGNIYEVVSVRFSGARCLIQSGNVLAN